jgi:hypothetical protein
VYVCVRVYVCTYIESNGLIYIYIYIYIYIKERDSQARQRKARMSVCIHKERNGVCVYICVRKRENKTVRGGDRVHIHIYIRGEREYGERER